MQGVSKKTIEQKRADFAFKKIGEVENKDSTLQSEYRSRVRQLPSLIMTNGLGQAMAFLFSKRKKDKETADQVLYNHVSDWLTKEAPKVGIIKWIDENGNEIKENEILSYITKATSVVYRQATSEALIFISWLKRFAEGKFEKR